MKPPLNTSSMTKNMNTKKYAAILRRLSVMACIAAVILSSHYYIIPRGASAAALLTGSGLGRTLIAVFAGLAGLALAELIWRGILVFRYQVARECKTCLLPTCSVIVPAYNEGRQVFKTLESLAASNYPKTKIQLIAVDDGSVDDTWVWIQKAKTLLGDGLLTIRQPNNQGKRHALNAGFERSSGEILITVDSDSMVEADTLRHLVAPFAFDRKVGAVAGNVRVLNMDQGIIPKMLDVAFVFSFDFIRASQSMVRTVMCTPGALSAYRKTVVMGVLKEWKDQTFWGRPANIGEDRALTNLIIREGYDVVFQQNARVFTQAPVRYTQLCKMYLRWARSNVREIIAMTQFIFKPVRKGSMWGARINLILEWVAMIKFPVLLLVAWTLIFRHPLTFGSQLFLGIIASSGLSAALYAWKFGRFSSLLAFSYGVFFFVGLAWIKPYALITPHNSGWLTREMKRPMGEMSPESQKVLVTTQM